MRSRSIRGLDYIRSVNPWSRRLDSGANSLRDQHNTRKEDIGPKLTATTSRKGKEKAKKFQMVVEAVLVSSPWKMRSRKSKQRSEREKGWQDSSFKFDCSTTDTSKKRADEFTRYLEKSEGFDVDSESRSFAVAGFYRVYPYYDWDTAQIQDQKAILNYCCTVAVDRHNQRTGDNLTFDKLVSANMLRDGFPIYFITLMAYPDDDKQPSKAYRTRVLFIRYHGVTDNAQAIINIHCFRPVPIPETKH